MDNWKMLNSSAIHKIYYDNQRHRLTIQFKSGSIYTYFNVSKPIYLGLLNSASPGRFYEAVIKGVYLSSGRVA